MTRLGWMISQLAVFGGLSYFLAIRGIALNPGKKADSIGYACITAFFLTLIIFGVINLIHNWLIRRRAKTLLSPSVGLADEPDDDSYSLRRIGPRPQDPLEVAEIPFREKPGKLLRPPS